MSNGRGNAGPQFHRLRIGVLERERREAEWQARMATATAASYRLWVTLAACASALVAIVTLYALTR